MLDSQSTQINDELRIELRRVDVKEVFERARDTVLSRDRNNAPPRYCEKKTTEISSFEA
jgi:hypothetical protein